MPQLIGTALLEVRPAQAGAGAGMLATARQFVAWHARRAAPATLAAGESEVSRV